MVGADIRMADITMTISPLTHKVRVWMMGITPYITLADITMTFSPLTHKLWVWMLGITPMSLRPLHNTGITGEPLVERKVCATQKSLFNRLSFDMTQPSLCLSGLDSPLTASRRWLEALAGTATPPRALS